MTRALAILLVFATAAAAHDAPSGWSYPRPCCSNEDCRPIACTDLRRERDGTWTYRPLNVRFVGAGESPDGDCHACWQNAGTPASNGICLFIPKGSV